MGVDETLARSAIRISFGMHNTMADVHTLLAALTTIAAKRRGALALV
jgi:cysteine sulfinate desulfinase/cysteine desulfurase-like protein